MLLVVLIIVCACVNGYCGLQHLSLNFLSALFTVEVPGRPDPPVLGKATHHSVELSWHPPSHLAEHGRLRYCIQEEDASKKDGFGTVYKYAKNSYN